MPLHEVFDAGGWRTVTRCEVLDTGGTWRQIKRREVLDADGTTWRTVAVYAPPLTVSITPSSAAGSAFSDSPTTVVTSSVTATPSGGIAPFTYSWAIVTNGGGTASGALSPAFATTTFAKTVGPGDLFTDTHRVTVTDAFGSTATADAPATFINNGGGIPE